MKTLEKLKDRKIKKAEKLMEKGGHVLVQTDNPDWCEGHITTGDHDCPPPE